MHKVTWAGKKMGKNIGKNIGKSIGKNIATKSADLGEGCAFGSSIWISPGDSLQLLNEQADRFFQEDTIFIVKTVCDRAVDIQYAI